MFKRLTLTGLALFSLSACDHQGLTTDDRLERLVPVKNGVKVVEYRGVRYAEAPTGKNRWRPPIPVSEREILDEWPPACVQGDGNVDWYKIVAKGFGADPNVIFDTPPTSEDCLFLNIWQPLSRDLSDLPVMVWIHGGGNVGGWAYEPNYIGAELASEGVIVVSIGYRLGVFGFLAHPQLSKESPHDSSGNYAILDQIEALKWIQRNIDEYGGNPENITVFGESAGAGNIGYLLVSPLADDLFHKAIMQSGGWPIKLERKLTENEVIGNKFTEDSRTSIAELRNLSALELVEKADSFYKPGYNDPPIDRWLLPGSPRELHVRKGVPRRSVMLGTNEHENLMNYTSTTKFDWARQLANYSEQQKTQIERLLEEKNLNEKMDALSTAEDFFCPTVLQANALLEGNSDVFMYRFAQERPNSKSLRAYHGAELPYVFDTHDEWLPTTSEDRTVSKEMKTAWINFARSGNPGEDGDWPEWSADAKAMIFRYPSMIGELDLKLCHALAYDI